MNQAFKKIVPINEPKHYYYQYVEYSVAQLMTLVTDYEFKLKKHLK